MRYSTIIAAGLAAAAVASCATLPASPPIPLVSSYDPSEQVIRTGNNSISGNAVLRTVGGEVRTCAGYPVTLVPVTAYATERFTAIYGNAQSGYVPLSQGKTFSPANPHYENEAGRTETCDSQGNFAFSGIADGSYYIVTMVVWGVPQSAYYTEQQGGPLFQRVDVSGGETKRIVLTKN